MVKKVSDGIADGSDGVSQVVLLKHYRDIKQKKLLLDQASAEYRLARKQAKSDGVDLAAMAMIETLDNLDTEDAALRLKHVQIYAGFLNKQWAQGDLFAVSDGPKPDPKLQEQASLADAEEDGQKCGMAGNSETLNPHKAGTEIFARWAKGHKNGKSFHDRSIAAHGGTKATGTRKGRKAASGNPEDRAAP